MQNKGVIVFVLLSAFCPSFPGKAQDALTFVIKSQNRPRFQVCAFDHVSWNFHGDYEIVYRTLPSSVDRINKLLETSIEAVLLDPEAVNLRETTDVHAPIVLFDDSIRETFILYNPAKLEPLSDDAIIFILAHELAHQTHGHALKPYNVIRNSRKRFEKIADKQAAKALQKLGRPYSAAVEALDAFDSDTRTDSEDYPLLVDRKAIVAAILNK
jgi:hypothetical protein